MPARPSFPWKRAALVALLLAACGGGASESQAAERAARHWIPGYREAFPMPEGVWHGLGAASPERALLARHETELVEQWRADPQPALGRELGRLYTLAQEHERGMAWLLGVLDDVDEDARVWLWLGANRLSAGEPDEARDLLEYAQELQPADPRIPRYLGEVHLRTGDLPTAETALRRAVEIDSGYTEALAELAALLEELERGPEARPYLERLVRLDPEHAPALFLLARLATERGDEALAGQLRERHARAVMLEDLGLRRAGVGRSEQLVSLGIAYLERDQPREAAREFRDVLEASEQPPATRAMARVGLCDALFRLGETESALEALALLEREYADHPMMPALRRLAAEHGAAR